MIRLGQLAAALATAGRLPLPVGARLGEMTLTVEVREPPVLTQDRLWRLAVGQPASRWLRWLGIVARLWRRPSTPWPQVTLTWSAGQIYATLTAPDEPFLSRSR